MGNPPIRKYRSARPEGAFTIIALSTILALITLDTRAGAVSESDLLFIPLPLPSGRYFIDGVNIEENIAESDSPTRFPKACSDADGTAAILKEDETNDMTAREITFKMLSRCTSEGLRNVRKAYKSLYNKELTEVIFERFNEWFSDFSPLVESLMMPWPNLVAFNINKAIVGKNYNKIGQILTPLVDDEVPRVAHALQSFYGQQVVTDLEALVDSIPGEFKKRLIKTQLRAVRSGNGIVDAEAACEDAKKIRDDLDANQEQKPAYDVTHEILTKRSFPQLRKINDCFRSLTGDTIMDTILNDLLSFYDLVPYSGILLYAKNKAEYFAEILREATQGGDNDLLMFVVAWRADIDLGNIKEAYRYLYGVSLHDDVKRATSDVFRDLLLTVIGE